MSLPSNRHFTKAKCPRGHQLRPPIASTTRMDLIWHVGHHYSLGFAPDLMPGPHVRWTSPNATSVSGAFPQRLENSDALQRAPQ